VNEVSVRNETLVAKYIGVFSMTPNYSEYMGMDGIVNSSELRQTLH
jgi:hypothetical protein